MRKMLKRMRYILQSIYQIRTLLKGISQNLKNIRHTLFLLLHSLIMSLVIQPSMKLRSAIIPRAIMTFFILILTSVRQ